MNDDSELDHTEGMKVGLTSEGNAVQIPLMNEEAAEMRRASDEWDEDLAELLTQEANYLKERVLEVLTTGSTTIRTPEGTCAAFLQRSRWRDGWLITEGAQTDGLGSSSGRTRISRRSSPEQLEAAITLQLGIELMSLREA